jgi:hypothetical protein
LQSARTVGKGKLESTPSYSSVSFAEDGEGFKAQNHYGIQFGYGLSDDTDLRVRIEHIVVDDNNVDVSATAIGFGPKFGKNDRFAFYLPIGFAVGEDIETSETWEILPTLLFTIPVNENLELNPSTMYIITTNKDSDNLIAFNLGAGFSSDLSKWMIRPEYGHLYNFNESGHFSQFSIGLTIYH